MRKMLTQALLMANSTADWLQKQPNRSQIIDDAIKTRQETKRKAAEIEDTSFALRINAAKKPNTSNKK